MDELLDESHGVSIDNSVLPEAIFLDRGGSFQFEMVISPSTSITDLDSLKISISRTSNYVTISTDRYLNFLKWQVEYVVSCCYF